MIVGVWSPSGPKRSLMFHECQTPITALVGSNAVSTIARLSLAEYDRMIERGVFDEGKLRRLEFIRGEIREMTPIGSLHEVVVDRLNEWSIRSLPKGRSGSASRIRSVFRI